MLITSFHDLCFEILTYIYTPGSVVNNQGANRSTGLNALELNYCRILTLDCTTFVKNVKTVHVSTHRIKPITSPTSSGCPTCYATVQGFFKSLLCIGRSLAFSLVNAFLLLLLLLILIEISISRYHLLVSLVGGSLIHI